MKITIISEDATVYKDGISYSHLNLVGIPEELHALQFNDTSNTGWIEFKQNELGVKSNNEPITELPSWAVAALIKWDETKTAEEAAIEASKIQVSIIKAEKLAAKLAAEQAANNATTTTNV